MRFFLAHLYTISSWFASLIRYHNVAQEIPWLGRLYTSYSLSRLAVAGVVHCLSVCGSMDDAAAMAGLLTCIYVTSLLLLHRAWGGPDGIEAYKTRPRYDL